VSPSLWYGTVRPVLERFPAPALQADAIGVAAAFSISTVFIAALMALMCTNVALLLFARAAIREGEMVVRSALGASRGRIIGQLFAEAVVLAAVSAVLGIAGAVVGLRWVYRAFESQSQTLPPWMMNGLSPSTVVYAVVLALVGAVVAGVLPGLRITDARGQLRLARAAGRSSGFHVSRIWGMITIGQIATSVVFVFITGVVGTETAALRSVDPGFPAAEYLGATLETDSRQGFAAGSDARDNDAFRADYEETTLALKRSPFVEPDLDFARAGRFDRGNRRAGDNDLDANAERDAEPVAPRVAFLVPDAKPGRRHCEQISVRIISDHLTHDIGAILEL
jgi:hypothetical protein